MQTGEQPRQQAPLPHPQGACRIMKTTGGGDPSLNPPTPDQRDHRGKKRNLQEGKSCRTVFGTKTFGYQTPSPLPPQAQKTPCHPPPPLLIYITGSPTPLYWHCLSRLPSVMVVVVEVPYVTHPVYTLIKPSINPSAGLAGTLFWADVQMQVVLPHAQPQHHIAGACGRGLRGSKVPHGVRRFACHSPLQCLDAQYPRL